MRSPEEYIDVCTLKSQATFKSVRLMASPSKKIQPKVNLRLIRAKDGEQSAKIGQVEQCKAMYTLVLMSKGDTPCAAGLSAN